MSPHRNGADPVALLPYRLGESCVFSAKQQHISSFKAELAEGRSGMTTAPDQPKGSGEIRQKTGEIRMGTELNMGPVVKACTFYGPVIDAETQRLDQGEGQLKGGTGSGDVAGIRRNTGFVEGDAQR